MLKYCLTEKCTLYLQVKAREAIYCHQCGSELKEAEQCSGCGRDLNPIDKFCEFCGRPVK
jgi:predicted amidophosphoribosyltransferase